MASTNAELPLSVTNAQNDEEVHHGCFLEEFREAKEVTNIIASLSNIYKDSIAVERALERFQCEHFCLLLLLFLLSASVRTWFRLFKDFHSVGHSTQYVVTR